MKKKTVCKIVIIIICFVFIFVFSKNFTFSKQTFGSGNVRYYELDDSESIKQIFSNVPLNCCGIEIPFISSDNTGMITLSLYDFGDNENYKNLIGTKTYDVSKIEGNSIELVLENSFFNTYASYAIEIKYENSEEGKISIPMISNQQGNYANRWDVTGNCEMIAASFLIKNYSVLLCVIIILITILIGLKYVIARDSHELEVSSFPKSLNGIWTCFFSFLVLLLFLLNIICKETFYGDYQYYTEKDIETNQEENLVTITQIFEPKTDELIRLFVSNYVLDNIDDLKIVITDKLGKEISYEKTDCILENDKYVLEVYNNNFSCREEYTLLIKGLTQMSKLTLDEEDITYQYKPGINWYRFGIVVIGFILIALFSVLGTLKKRILLPHKIALLLFVILNSIFYMCLFFFVFFRYRNGDTWKFMFSYGDVWVVLVECAFMAICCKVIDFRDTENIIMK